MNWLKRLFSSAPECPPQKEVRYCKRDGSLLTVTKDVLEYSPYTGQPASFKVVKTCPVCGTVIDSEIIVA